MNKRGDSWMTVAELCEELHIARSTFDDWRAKQRGPKCIRLPNRALRIKRTDYHTWLTNLEDAA